MASYYYLVSSLPTITADSGMPISYDEFLTMCQSVVSEETYRLLEDLTLYSDEGPLMQEWGAFYSSLMNELNSQRSLKLGRPYNKIFDKDPACAEAVTSAINARDPLTAEKILLEYEFRQLDDLVGLHIFDDHVLFGYALKLKLMERLNRFSSEKGRKEFSDILGGLQTQITSL